MDSNCTENSKVKISDWVEVTPASDHLFQMHDNKKRCWLNAELIPSNCDTVDTPDNALKVWHWLVVAFLTMQIRGIHLSKLRYVLCYFHCNSSLPLTLETKNMWLVEWWIDAAFTVHPDFKGHRGCSMTMGNGSVITVLTKQKISMWSSSESEIVGEDNFLPRAIWANLFINAQRYNLKIVLYQDNQAARKLELNGVCWSSPLTWYLNVHYFSKDEVD